MGKGRREGGKRKRVEGSVPLYAVV